MTDEQVMFRQKQALAPELRPQQWIPVEMPVDRRVRNQAERELRDRAGQDSDGCHGYYAGSAETDAALPHSQAFAEGWPEIVHGGKVFTFDWMKFSEGKLPKTEGFHLDRSRATGLGREAVDEQLVPLARIWRILVNLHPAERRLSWLDVDAHDLEWQEDERSGFISLAEPEQVASSEMQELILPQRPRLTDLTFQAALLCVSRVAHGARETDRGHFLASWSCEEMS